MKEADMTTLTDSPARPRTPGTNDGERIWIAGDTLWLKATAGDRPGRLLVLFTPGGIEGFFREAGRAALGDGPPPAVDADEIARTEIAGRRYGLRVIAWAQ
jgi:hypothetical protein